MNEKKKDFKPDEQGCVAEESEEIQERVQFKTLKIRGAEVGLVQKARKKKRELIDC